MPEVIEGTAVEEAGRALVVTGWAMPPDIVAQRMREIAEYRAIMHEGEDYGVIPGTEKPTLFQPGADTLCQAAGLWAADPVFIERVEDWDKGFFYYLVSVTLRDDRGRHWTGIGSCNSREKKYASRWAPLFTLTPDQKQAAQAEGWDVEKRRSKKGNEVEWVRIPNDDPYTLVNTFQKMAAKRAYVAATLRATGAHRVFTQDVEDFIEGEVVSREEAPPKAAPKRATASADPEKAEPEHVFQMRHRVNKAVEQAFPNIEERQKWRDEHMPEGIQTLDEERCEEVLTLLARD